jgi:hypothetical protein
MMEKNPNALIEALYLIPEAMPIEKRTTLFNQFLKVSELDEIRYFNPEHNQSHRLFGFSYRIKDKDKPEVEVTDLNLANLPRQMKMYVHQELLPVGPMTSEFSLSNQGGKNGPFDSERYQSQLWDFPSDRLWSLLFRDQSLFWVGLHPVLRCRRDQLFLTPSTYLGIK